MIDLLKPRSAAKLSVSQVKAARALSRYFTKSSIALALDVCPKTIFNLLKQRSWAWLPVDDMPLPLLTFDKARR